MTYCFSDWNAKIFQNGIARMKDGKKTDVPIRRPLLPDEREGIDYFVKPDPNFKNFTYSRCHQSLRRIIQPDDILFFRTLWRQRQYMIGFFTIAGKTGLQDDPVLHADPKRSRLIDFALPITRRLAEKINPHTSFKKNAHENAIINGRLGRNFKKLSPDTTEMLRDLIENYCTETQHKLYRVLKETLKCRRDGSSGSP